VSFEFFDDGDEDFGINCIVDGTPCMNNSTASFAAGDGFPAGTIVKFDEADDDFATTYNFCQTLTKTKKNLHTVALNLLVIDESAEIWAIDVEVTSANVKDPTLA
jgi:hypothetical protein